MVYFDFSGVLRFLWVGLIDSFVWAILGGWVVDVLLLVVYGCVSWWVLLLVFLAVGVAGVGFGCGFRLRLWVWVVSCWGVCLRALVALGRICLRVVRVWVAWAF